MWVPSPHLSYHLEQKHPLAENVVFVCQYDTRERERDRARTSNMVNFNFFDTFSILAGTLKVSLSLYPLFASLRTS